MQRIRIGKKQKLIGGLLLASLVVLAIILNAGAIKNQLNDWKLLPQPERLTELYYENHTKLPAQYTAGAPQSFTFTVHNLEYRDTAYRYTISEENEDGSQHQTLASGAFNLKDGAYRSTAITVSPADLGNRVRIITTLNIDSAQNESETLHYWVNNTVKTANPTATQGAVQ